MPQDWFAQFAPLTQIPQSPVVSARISSDDDDWFSQFSPTAAGDAFAREAGVSAVIPEIQSDPLGRFIGGAWGMLNPIEAVKGVASAVAHPIDTVTGIAQAHGQQFGKAADAYQQGRYSEMLGHGAAGMLPLLGPVAANIGEQIGSGDVAGGLGATTGLATGILAPGALARRAQQGLYVPPLLGTALDPVSAAAVAAGQKAGVAIDAATATGNRFIQAAQHYSDRMLGGAGVAGRAGQEQARGLASMGEQLAAKANAIKLTPEAAKARAIEQGYKIDALHGRSGDYYEVSIPAIRRSTDAGAVGEGFYASAADAKGADTASFYASRAGERSNVMPVKLRLERPLVIERDPRRPIDDPRPMAMRKISEEWGLSERPKFDGSKQTNDAWASEFSSELRRRGHDGVVVKGADGSPMEYMVLDSDQARSRFAAFDPEARPGSLAGLREGVKPGAEYIPGQPVTMEQAGAGARSAVLGEVQKHHATANDAYAELRRIEALEENAMTVAPKLSGTAAAEGALPAARGPRGAQRFAKQGESTEGLFQGVLGDARRNGFTGSADELRTEFLDRLASAKSLGVETSGMDGLGLDDLLTQLQQEGKWLEYGDDPMTLWRHLEDIAADPKALDSVKHDLEHLLEGAGVKPGEKWWQTGSGEKVVQLPVALEEVKTALRPKYDALLRESQLTPFISGSEKGKALNALDRLMRADDFASLSDVDGALSELKAFSRSNVPELRSVGQGVAARAVKNLEDAVQRAVEIAGPEAVAARDAGRAATRAKYAAAEVLKEMPKKSAVRTAKGFAAPKDAGVEKLRALAKQAPAELPKIGRAVLDELIARATANGGFRRGASIAEKWQEIGKETKLLLYKDPGYVKDLDNFFNLVRMMANNANPSGTASTTAAGAQGIALVGAAATFNPLPALATVAGPYAVSKFLHSAAGVRLLTKGFKIPAGNRAAQAAYMAQLSAFAQKLGTTNPNERQTVPVPVSR